MFRSRNPSEKNHTPTSSPSTGGPCSGTAKPHSDGKRTEALTRGGGQGRSCSGAIGRKAPGIQGRKELKMAALWDFHGILIGIVMGVNGMLLGFKWDFVGFEFGGMRIENSWILNGRS